MKWSVLTNNSEREFETLSDAFKHASALEEDHEWVSIQDETGLELSVEAAFDRLWRSTLTVVVGDTRKEFRSWWEAVEFAALCMRGTKRDSVRLFDIDGIEMDVDAEINRAIAHTQR